MVTLLTLSILVLVPMCGPQRGIGDHPTDEDLSAGTPTGRLGLELSHGWGAHTRAAPGELLLFQFLIRTGTGLRGFPPFSQSARKGWGTEAFVGLEEAPEKLPEDGHDGAVDDEGGAVGQRQHVEELDGGPFSTVCLAAADGPSGGGLPCE